MGWEVADDSVGHDGIWFTYTASIRLLPSGYGVAVLGNSGLGLGNEGTGELADKIADLVEGGDPDPIPPLRLPLDLVLGGLTVLTLALGVRRMVRRTAWLDKYGNRSTWRLALRTAPRLLPVVLWLFLPDLLGWFTGGRDITLLQLCYTAPALMVWAALAAILNLVTIVMRTAMIIKLRSQPEPVAS